MTFEARDSAAKVVPASAASHVEVSEGPLKVCINNLKKYFFSKYFLYKGQVRKAGIR